MTPEKTCELLDEALLHAKGTHTREDVAREIAEGRLKLWVGEASVGVTEFVQFPRRRVLNVFLAGGDMDDLRRCVTGIEAYARGGGADAMMFHGRATRGCGWARLWPDYEPAWICMWKDLRTEKGIQ